MARTDAAKTPSEPPVGRRLAAVLSADVAGYSRLVERDEEGTVRRIKSYWEHVVRPAVVQHGGRVVKLMGDGALIEFTSVVEAVRCALEVQGEISASEQERPGPEQIRYRVGVHLGDVIIDGDDIQGHGVNVAARLQTLAEPGTVCISDAVRAALGQALPVSFRDLGQQIVKNIAEPVHAFRVLDQASSTVRMKGRPQPFWLAGIAAVGVALVSVAIVIYSSALDWRRPRAVETPAAQATAAIGDSRLIQKPTVAVLPFLNLSGDAEQDYFADGLTEDLIIDLANVSGLFVISRNSVFTYKNQQVRPKQVALDLGVTYVLNGSVRKAGGRVRITSELVEAASDRQLWAGRFDRELTDIFSVQDEVKREILGALAVTLNPAEKVQVSKVPTKSVEAYEYYLRGRHAMNLLTRRSIRLAYWSFEKAIELDPNFAEARASLATTYAIDLTGTYSWADWVRPPGRARAQATLEAVRAAELKPALALPELVFARLSLADWEYDAAVEHARKALEHEPGNADAYAMLALALTASGSHREAVGAVGEALRRDPKASPSTLGTLGVIQFALRDYTGAAASLEQSHKALITGDNWLFASFLAASYGQLGKPAPAWLVPSPTGAGIVDVTIAQTSFQRFYRRREDMQQLIEGLQRAGIPEFQFGVGPKPGARAITDLGQFIGKPFDALCASPRLDAHFQIGTNGSIDWTARHDISDAGQVRPDNGKICITLPILTRNKEACYSVFRTDDVANNELVRGYDFVLLGPTVCYFSAKK